MNCILFCANPKIADVSDAVEHLRTHDRLYFEVRFPIVAERFPITGFVHISGDRVKYAVRIEDILPFSKEHYEGPRAGVFKPQKWLDEWANNMNNVQNEPWKHALVFTTIECFEYDTYSLEKRDHGGRVSHPPQKYIKILPPGAWHGFKF